MRWLIVLAVFAGGCSQAYEGIGLTTGSIPMTTAVAPTSSPVKPVIAASANLGRPAERVSGNLFRILPDDRRIADRIEKENYTLLRAAEATLAQGGTHFVLVSAGDQAATGMPSLKAIFSGDRDAEYGAYIRVLRVESDGSAPAGSMAAEEIIHFFGPKFGRTPT